jgi:hypothetical protein
MSFSLWKNNRNKIKMTKKHRDEFKFNNTRGKRSPFLVLIIVALIFGGLHYSTTLFSLNPEKNAWGKIITPQKGSKANKSIKVVGETQVIKKGFYIWLALEKLDTGLCQPKKRVLRNTRFITTILHENQKGTFKLSLYFINETTHKKWQAFQNKKPSEGLPQPPAKKRLDQVTLILNQQD